MSFCFLFCEFPNLKSLEPAINGSCSLIPSVHLTQSNRNHMMEAFNNYLKNVKNITGKDSPVFYEDIRKEFEKELNKTTPRKVCGIVVGVINGKGYKHGNLFLSTGSDENSNESEFKSQMLRKLSTIQENKNVIFLRTPMISVHHSKNVKGKLIRAFEPVIFEILKIILKNSSNGYEEQLPILCLGINSYICVSNCLKDLNRPKFILISSVHPNHMKFLDEMIDNVKSQGEKLRLVRRKMFDLDVFLQAINVFYHLTK